ERIRRYWGRRAEVVHPPVAVERFRWDQPRDDTYLCLCRLVPYKRVDLVIEAFNRTGLPLLVVGDGPERQRLQALAGPTVTLLGRQDAAMVNGLLARCRAYVFAGLEDFGIAPVEAMAAGAPVIGFGGGGLLDTVRCLSQGLAEPTGLLFPEQSIASLVAALEHFHQGQLWRQLPPERQRAWAGRFSGAQFRQRFAAVLDRAWHDHGQRRAQRSKALAWEDFGS
ncbi:MAG: glycosyltransferase, partial [Synechococcus sp. ELA619]